ncbi:hypothetical protein [Tropicimonas sediminicola]|uniref:Tetratricopeptide repeat-containing protein n=1 Tax=Tropicimonas sediminicola TaxID=1031541 RepID=A0A239JCQ5_9RHOB|nr:hypothetical protein [Tropicimonas sediminicola]SNT03826.1 hypothetical protein SAMN05421757_105220 [Tropicimonas sediminicola]
MTIRWAAIAICLGLASPAMAENVRVLSGEHADFSRIVLIFGKPVSWEEENTNGGFSLRFDRSDMSFDFSRVFDLIPRDRIQAISFDAERGSLEMESDCGCSMQVFWAGKNTVAIDIATDPEADIAALPALTSGLPMRPSGFSSFGVPVLGFSIGRDIGSPPVGRPGRAANSLTEQELDAGTRNHKAMEEALLRQLGRAASQGLVDVRLPDGRADDEAPTSRLPGGFRQAGHLNSETVFDQFLPPAEPGSRSHAPDACGEEALYDPAQWRTDPADDAISRARGQILDARENPDATAVAHLVRTYLSLGFGAEARAVLQEFHEIDLGAPYLRAIADLMDPPAQPRSDQLSALSRCGGPAAVWAALGETDPTQLADLNTEDVQSWFFRFPPNLRRQLGPRLVKTLHAAGHVDAAESVRNSLGRSLEKSAPDLVLLDATTRISPSRTEAALAKLPDLQSSDAAASAEATNLLLKQGLRDGRLEPRTVTLAEALAAETAGSEIGLELLSGIAQGHAMLGDFGSSLAFHRKWAEVSTDNNGPDQTLSRIVSEMVAQEDDSALLRYLEGGDPVRDPERLSKETRFDVAERLLEVGLWRPAQAVLARQRGDGSLRYRQLSAEAALQGRDAKLALAMLAGEPDPESALIRARALSATGNHAEASHLLFDAGDRPGAAREAWLSGQADLIGNYGGAPEQSLVAVSSADPGAAAGSLTEDREAITLDKARTLLGRSGEMRAHLSSLFSER